MVTPVYISDRKADVGYNFLSGGWQPDVDFYRWMENHYGPPNPVKNCSWEETGTRWYYKHLPAVHNNHTRQKIRDGLVEFCFQRRADAMHFKLVWG